jgi:hypothetical protein
MKLAGIFEKGWTRYHRDKTHLYFARKARVKSFYDKDGYELIISGHKVYGRHQDTEQIGDIFVYDKYPLVDAKKYISKKKMIEAEKYFREQLDDKTRSDDRDAEENSGNKS